MKSASASTQELLAQMIALAQKVDVTVAGDATTAASVERFAVHMKQQVQLAVDVFTALGNRIQDASQRLPATDKKMAAKFHSVNATNPTGGTSPTAPVHK
jgi:hypothetical protein